MALEDTGSDVLGLVQTVEAALALIESDGDRLHAAVLDVNLGAGSTSQPVAERFSARECRTYSRPESCGSRMTPASLVGLGFGSRSPMPT